MTRRPIKFKLDAYRLYATRGMTPMEAFAEAGKLNTVPLSGCMTTKAYASGYMSDDIKNYLRKQLVLNNKEVHEYFSSWKLTKQF
jgi:hypothetical protein